MLYWLVLSCVVFYCVVSCSVLYFALCRFMSFFVVLRLPEWSEVELNCVELSYCMSDCVSSACGLSFVIHFYL